MPALNHITYDTAPPDLLQLLAQKSRHYYDILLIDYTHYGVQTKTVTQIRSFELKCQRREEAVLARELRTIEKQEKRLREGKIHFEETFSPLLLPGNHGHATNRIGKSRKNEAIRRQAQAEFQSIVRSTSSKIGSTPYTVPSKDRQIGVPSIGVDKGQGSLSKQLIKSKYSHMFSSLKE